MSYQFSFVLAFWSNNHSFEEVEEESVYSQNNGKDMVIVTVQTKSTCHKLGLIDVVIQL